MKRLFQLSSVLAFTVALVLLAQRGTAEGSGGSISGMAPSWELSKAGGGTLSMSELEGKIVIIDFWATWCPPCRAKVPSYIELQDAYRDEGVVFVGISLDQGANVEEKVLKFISDYKINYPVVFGTPEVVDAFGGIPSIPTTFVVNREGQLVSKSVGFKPKDYYAEAIDSQL